MNADFPDATAQPVVVTARGNWTGLTTGGLILSEDDCHSWQRLPDPVAISPLVDALLAGIRRPNVNAGWVALSADGGTLLWGLARGHELPVPALLWSENHGVHWQRCLVLDQAGVPVRDEAACIKVFSDRVRPDWFFGFGQAGQLYASVNRGHTFREVAAPLGFPAHDLAGIDGHQHYEIRMQPGAPGVVWLALADFGLWRLIWDPAQEAFGGHRVSVPADNVFRVGLGKPAESAVAPALFLNGVLGGVYGFYRSLDGGATFARINTDAQMYGDIRSIAGDPRTFGRIYIATGTRGVLYGDPLGEVPSPTSKA